MKCLKKQTLRETRCMYIRYCILQSPEPVVKPEPKRNATTSNNNNHAKNLGSKFQDVQRKWMLSPPPMGESDSSDLDLQDPVAARSQSAFPLGHSSVKSLSSKFQQPQG